MGEDHWKVPPGAVQVGTEPKLDPSPYSSTIGCAVALPPLRHCSPLKRIVTWSMVVAVALVTATAIQPAMVPLSGLPK